MRTWIVPTLVAAALTAAPVSATADADVVARWHMDERSGASVMHDSAGAGGRNNGAVHSVRTGVRGLLSGRSYAFDGATSYVRVPDAAALDPGKSRISLRATVRIADRRMRDDSYDLVRKGLLGTKGGYWKMEVKRTAKASVGRLHCVFKGRMPDGTMRIAKKVAKRDIVDGRIHRLRCVRTSKKVQAVVDGRVYTKNKATGSIANKHAVIVGAKRARDDVLKGRLDEVVIKVG